MRSIFVISFFLIVELGVCQTGVPYFQNFDSVTVSNWTHYSTFGTDDWVYGSPTKVTLNGTFSGGGSAVTKISGNYSASSSMYLETPEFDLITASAGIHIAFYHRNLIASTSTKNVQYSINGGLSWTVLDEPGSDKIYWPISGTGSTFVKSIHNLDFLIGNLVKFRFLLNSASSTNEGWQIDNFEMTYDILDIKANNQPGIYTDICKYTDQISVSGMVSCDYTYYFPALGTVAYYLSNDPVFDGSDVLYQTGSYSVGTSSIPLPVFPHAGSWYIFYFLDNANIVAETNETNNTAYAALVVDTMYYQILLDFENDTIQFEKGVSPLTYSSGNPVINGWKLKTTGMRTDQLVFRGKRSVWNTNANVESGTANQYYVSPFFDLSSETSQTMICMWNRHQSMLFTGGGLYANGGLQVSDLNHAPYFSVSGYTGLTTIPFPIGNEWGCACVTIPASPTLKFKKFRLILNSDYYGSDYATFISGDDLYVGSSSNDLTIPEKRELFTTTDEPIFQYNYNLWNAGVKSVSTTHTHFYWSTDTLLDGSDIFLGLKNEASFAAATNATMHSSSYSFTKPILSEGTFYLIAQVDADNLEVEYNENNNTTILKIEQQNTKIPPYENDFELDANGWHSGGSIFKNTLQYGNSPTSLTGYPFEFSKLFYSVPPADDSMCRMELYTPTFDLTGMTKPTLEFRLAKLGVLTGPWAAEAQVNISYSTDHGYTWTLLNTSSTSYKGMYSTYEYSAGGGTDFANSHYGVNLYVADEPDLAPSNFYQSRDCRETSKHVVEISPLGIYNHIKFRFNIGFNVDMSGYSPVLIDEFKLTESIANLEIIEKKPFYIVHPDTLLFIDGKLDNTGNYESTPTTLRFYFSTDTILDAGDYFLANKSIPAIAPSKNYYYNLQLNFDSSDIKPYLIYQIDQANSVVETNEGDNIGYFPIINNAITPPYYNDFSDSLYTGWNPYVWENKVTKLLVNTFRFRNKTVVSEPVFVTPGANNCFATDRYENFSSAPYTTYPVFFILSPPFDFSAVNNMVLTFKLSCIGSYTSTTQGGTIEVSLDGGVTWDNISDVGGSYNWYNWSNITTLDGADGWYTMGAYTSTTRNLDSVRVAIGYLGGQKNVRFRFRFCAKYLPYGSGSPSGMRIDDFRIDANPIIGGFANQDLSTLNTYYNNGTIFIQNNTFSSDCIYTIINTQGKLVKKGRLNLQNGINTITIDNKIASGVYLVNFISGQNTSTMKFLVN